MKNAEATIKSFRTWRVGGLKNFRTGRVTDLGGEGAFAVGGQHPITCHAFISVHITTNLYCYTV